MSTQLCLKSTVRRSSRLNPTFKKKLGFQKLEIEFISKSRKRPRTDSKDSPVLFDSQDDITVLSQEVDKSKLDVKFTKLSVKNGGQLKDVSSQNPVLPSTHGTIKFTDTVFQRSAATSRGDIKKFIDSGLNSQDFAYGIKKFTDTDLSSQDSAFPCTLDIEPMKAKVRTVMKSKPLRKQRKAPPTVCDGNILPENFRKSTLRASKKQATVKSTAQKMSRSRNNKKELWPKYEINLLFEPVKNQQNISQAKKERKPRTSTAVKSAKKKSQNNFPVAKALLEPVKIEATSQKTRPCSRKLNHKTPTEKPVKIRRIKLPDKKQSAFASDETELCSLLSYCSIKGSGEKLKSFYKPRSEFLNSRQNTNVGTSTAFIGMSLSDMYKKDTDSANTDDLSDFSDLFSLTLNVGNFSENLNIMSLLRKITKIEKKMPHFVPFSENWYQNFEIW